MHPLAARLARGDESAFAELYDACADRLHRYAASRIGSPDAASDIVQTVFLRTVRSRRQFRHVDNPIAYLFQIARNEIARAFEERERHDASPLPAEVIAGTKGLNVADGEALAIGLSRLSVDDRELVELKILAGLTFREIAEVTHLPQGTIATRYRRAMDSLRKWMKSAFSNN